MRWLNKSYDNVIVADKQTKVRPFETYLCGDRHKLAIYPSNEKAEINWNLMNDKLIIWRKTSLTRPLTCSSVDLLLGHDFEARLHDNFSCIYNTGEARAFINFSLSNQRFGNSSNVFLRRQSIIKLCNGENGLPDFLEVLEKYVPSLPMNNKSFS